VKEPPHRESAGKTNMTATLVEATRAAQDLSVWPRYPSIYEINTWVWLSEISHKYGTTINLSCVPPAEWDAIASFGFDAVWFMGVWERSPTGIAVSNQNASLLEDFRRALPDFRSEDNVGSPYCVRRYVVDDALGGCDGLAVARRELSKRRMNLVLDFVPNHVAPDHPWVAEHPEFFIHGNAGDIHSAPGSYMEACGRVFACGRDPYFPAWYDVLQLNAFEPTLRQAVIATLSNIAEQCDGVRCDMAILVMNSTFELTWGDRAGPRPSKEYWQEVIPIVKDRYPGFLFVAEAYWGLEWELQQQGFDFCYDKTLYDRMEHGTPESIRLHLCADLAYQNKLLRFIENHDEPRAAATFPAAKQQAVAVCVSTLPGTRLFHEGQFEGRKVRLPVFLGRRPPESFDESLSCFYRALVDTVNTDVFRSGQWSLCERTGWPDNPSFQNLVSWSWTLDDQRYLIAINLSDHPAQGLIEIPWAGGQTWYLTDVLSHVSYERAGDEMRCPGLYVDLGPWNYHFFQCSVQRRVLDRL
jgi:hypothetical protein